MKTQPLRITVTKTRDGRDDYVQIMSADQFSVNIVLISSKITLEDRRGEEAGVTDPKRRPLNE